MIDWLYYVFRLNVYVIILIIGCFVMYDIMLVCLIGIINVL